ncbi:MAG: 6-bladed beta-propeller [Rikenellaceae bacterium]
MRELIYITLCLFLAYGCGSAASTEQVERIELTEDIANYPYINESEISVSYDIFTLESRGKEGIIPQISKIVEHNGYLFVLSYMGTHNEIYIFKSDGEYVTTLRKGRARNEFLAAMDINVDPESNLLEVLDRHSCAILSYSFDGKFMSKTSLPKKSMFEFCRLPNSEYLTFTSIHLFKEDTDSYFHRVQGETSLQGYLDKPKGLPNFIMGWHITKSGDDIYCSGIYGNTCYKFNKDSLSFEPYLQIDPILDVESKHLSGDSELLKSYFSRFYSFRMFCDDSLLAFYASSNTSYNVMYNRNDKTLYQHIFNQIPYLGFSLVGQSGDDEFYYIYAEQIEELNDYPLNSKVTRSIVDELMTKDSSVQNPYIIRISYDKK